MADPEKPTPENEFDDESDESEEESDESSDEDDEDDDDAAKPAAPAEAKNEEDEFEFGNDVDTTKDEIKGVTQTVSNQHFDEALSVSEDEESIDDSVSMDQSMDQQSQARAAQPVAATSALESKSSDEESDEDDSDDDDEGDSDSEDKSHMKAQMGVAPVQSLDKDDDDEDESSSSESDEDDDTAGDGAKLYDPKDYQHLKVSAEIQDLFDYIARYKPNEIELETKLQPFIPDFIPAVGEIDPFIKVPCPDGTKDDLGLVVLDEPAAHQSDPTVLDIKMRVMSKHPGIAPVKVRSIENAEKNPKKITTWINNIEEVHRKKPPPAVTYSRYMPDIEQLMQVWPTEFEELLKEIPLPSAELDMEVRQYAKIVCALLDIPVYDDKLVESLHVLFTLYTEFKNNAHFQQ